MKTLPLLAALPVFMSLFAQAQVRQHEVSVYGEGGLSTLHYSLPSGASRNNSAGGGGGLGYTSFFTNSIEFGLHTGVGVSLLRSAVRLSDGFGSAVALVDEYYEAYELRSTFVGYTERQAAVMLHLPLLLHYQSKRYSSGRRYYARAGLRLELPLYGRYRTSIASLTNEHYYADLDVTLREPAYKGLGEFSGVGAEGSLKLSTSVVALAEVGAKWQLSRRVSLYAGLYAGCGLSSVAKPKQDGDFVVRSEAAPSEFGVSSVVGSRYATDKYFTDKVLPLSVGGKVELAVNMWPARLATARNIMTAAPQPYKALAEWVQTRQTRQKMENRQEWQNVEKEERLRRQQEKLRSGEELTEEEEEGKKEKEEKEKEEQQQQQQQQQQERERSGEEQRQVEADSLQKGAEFCEEGSEQLFRLSGYSVSQVNMTSVHVEELEVVLAQLRLNPSLKVLCIGSSCNMGIDAVKLNVSKRRAESVRKYFLSQGIDESRVSIIAASDSLPLVPNTSERNRKENRRVDVVTY